MLYTNQDFQPHHAVWASHTQGTGPFRLVMQPDNNLVIYDSHGHGALDCWVFAKLTLTLLGAATWSTNSCGRGHGPCRIEVQNDRNVVLYAHNREVLWASNTGNGEPC